MATQKLTVVYLQIKFQLVRLKVHTVAAMQTLRATGHGYGNAMSNQGDFTP